MNGGWWLSVYVGMGWGVIGLIWIVVNWCVSYKSDKVKGDD